MVRKPSIRITKEKKRAEGLAAFDHENRINSVVVGILGPVTRATSTRAKHILVITDRFTLYAIAVPLALTESADVAREILQQCILKGENFGGKLIHEIG